MPTIGKVRSIILHTQGSTGFKHGGWVGFKRVQVSRVRGHNAAIYVRMCSLFRKEVNQP